MKNKQRILLLGKNGQIGQSLLRRENENFEIFGFDRMELDITYTPNIKRKIEKINPDIIINATAYHVPQECEDHSDDAFAINATAIFHLAQICNEKNITLLTYSTDYVFDGEKGKPYIETDIPHPLQVYGVSKLAGELLAAQYNKNTYIMRTCAVFGGKEGSRAKKGNFVLMILREAEQKLEMEMSSEQIVSPTYAGDLAETTLKLLSLAPAYGLYHLVNEGNCSWAEFANEIVKQKNLPMKIIPVNRKGQHGNVRKPLFSALRNTKAKKLHIILPTWQEGLHAYLQTL